VVALDRRDGRVIWESPPVGQLAGYSSPALVEHHRLRMIVTLTAKSIIAVRADDGDLLWQHPHETSFDENIFTPLHHEGHLFVSTQFTGSVLLRLLVDGQACTVEKAWDSAELDNHHGGVVLVDGHLYGSGRGNADRWACLDWETGALRYLERGLGKGAVVTADGMLFTLSERGVAGLVVATPAGHEVVGQFRLPAGGEGPVFTHPAIAGGRLYLRHGDRLYCYDIRNP
jgi:outer membrane protein assembly factor BamB